MASSVATSSGTRTALSVKLHLPSAGRWRAEVILDTGDAPTGKATLTVADLTLVGSVLRSNIDAADRPHATIVGGIGWHNLIRSPVSFQSDSGVRLATVLDTMASATGQPIQKPADRTIGNYFEIVASRTGEPVHWAEILDQLVRAGHIQTWRVDGDGTTRFVSRTSAEFSGRATLLRRDSGIGITTYGVDSAASLLPGNTIDGVVISRVDIRDGEASSQKNSLEADVYSAESAPEIREIFRRMIASWVNDTIRTYVVESAESDGRLNLSPPSDSPHLPEIGKCEQWILGGAMYRAVKGDEVIVAFADARHERPMVVGVKLGSGDYLDVARSGDTVKVLFPPMTFTGTISGAPAAGVVLSPVPYTLGSIQTGSQRVGVRT